MATPTSEGPSADGGSAGLHGREGLLVELERRVCEGTSLLVLVGPPGVGKTTLALALARRLAEGRPGGAVVCPLSHASSVDDVASALARLAELDTRDIASAEDVIEAALRALGTRHGLLVLDDAETIPDALVLSSARPPTIATATRTPPGFSGHAVDVPALDLASARSLFVAHAGGAAITAIPSEDVDALLARLEHLPLAIELAAAHARSMTRAERTRGSVDSLLLRETGTTGLDAALESALSVLPRRARDALVSLSAFRESFSLDAAHRVLSSNDPLTRAEATDLLGELVDRSLAIQVTRAPRADEARFALSSPVRAHVRRASASASVEAADEAHRRHFVGRARELLAELSSRDAARARARLLAERENLAAAFERSLLVDPEGAVTIAAALERLLDMRGTAKTILDVLDAAVRATRGRDAAVRARALALRGWSAQSLGHGERATADLEAALPLAREVGAEREADVLAKLGHHALRYGRLEDARRALEEAHELARTHQLDILPSIDDRLGILALEEARTADAIAHFEAAGRGHERRDDLPGAAAARSSRAVALLAEGRLTEARADIELVMRWAEILDAPRLLGVAAVNLGLVHQEEGAFEAAARAHEDAARTMARVGYRRAEATAHRRMGLLSLERGAHDEAIRAIEHALAIYREHRYVADESRCLALLALAGAFHEPERRRRAERDLDAARALANRPDADELLDLVCRVLGGEAAPPDRLRPTSLGSFPEIVVVRRLVERVLGATDRDRALTVQRHGDWFAVGGRATNLERRGPMRRVLSALATAHAEERGRAIDVYGLLDAGWPGERLHPEAGAARVYETIRQLRRLGLGELLVTKGDGYLLDPHTKVSVVDGPMRSA